ncbi:MAG: hypothetical protein M1829_004011 [Trizodia sp. TS-e1964]|nr:MAG: hypothetical protein M1829_004011 [Trizodia sp. TS-e1964]
MSRRPPSKPGLPAKSSSKPAPQAPTKDETATPKLGDPQFYLEDLSLEEISKLTMILSDPCKKGVVEKEGLVAKQRYILNVELIAKLPKNLLRPNRLQRHLVPMLKPFVDIQPCAKLCRLHQLLNGQLISNIFKYLRHELTRRVELFAARVSQPFPILHDLEGVSAMWLKREEFMTKFKYSPPKKWTFQVEKCEACMIGRISGDEKTLEGLRSILLARKHSKGPPPRLLCWVESAIENIISRSAKERIIEASDTTAYLMRQDCRSKRRKEKDSKPTEDEPIVDPEDPDDPFMDDAQAEFAVNNGEEEEAPQSPLKDGGHEVQQFLDPAQAKFANRHQEGDFNQLSPASGPRYDFDQRTEPDRARPVSPLTKIDPSNPGDRSVSPVEEVVRVEDRQPIIQNVLLVASNDLPSWSFDNISIDQTRASLLSTNFSKLSLVPNPLNPLARDQLGLRPVSSVYSRNVNSQVTIPGVGLADSRPAFLSPQMASSIYSRNIGSRAAISEEEEPEEIHPAFRSQQKKVPSSKRGESVASRDDIAASRRPLIRQVPTKIPRYKTGGRNQKEDDDRASQMTQFPGAAFTPSEPKTKTKKSRFKELNLDD